MPIEDTPLKRLKAKWLNDKDNHLVNGLVDVGAATKDLLNNAKVSMERRGSLKGNVSS